MKKALSLLLAVAMLASMCTVSAWAEDEIFLDIPVIEEVTEEFVEIYEEDTSSNNSIIIIVASGVIAVCAIIIPCRRGKCSIFG